MIVFGEPSATARQLTAAIGQDAHAKERERAAWRAFAGDANARTWQVIDAELESTGETLTEAHTARGVVAALPPDSTLVVGNSLAVRVVGMFCRQGAARATVLSQRGASGIDGLIAGAVGAGSRSANPVTLLIGDVSFLHDVSSLAFATKTQVPLVIVVLQNRGGRIFEQLPIASINDLEREILEMATTPHQHDVLRLAAAYGVRCERAEHPKALDDALRRAYSNAGCTVVEAITPTSGSAAAQLHRIGAAVDAALFRME
jgi:2-succinyl-5-enolpyruvyl-6-hydroxy-3-cyclohexene-1-carboxylate synthase